MKALLLLISVAPLALAAPANAQSMQNMPGMNMPAAKAPPKKKPAAKPATPVKRKTAAKPAAKPTSAKRGAPVAKPKAAARSEEHTSELQSLMRISYAVFCLQKKTILFS